MINNQITIPDDMLQTTDNVLETTAEDVDTGCVASHDLKYDATPETSEMYMFK